MSRPGPGRTEAFPVDSRGVSAARARLPRPAASEPADLIDVGDVWANLRRHRRFILASGLSAAGLVFALTLILGMSFRATAQLYLGEVELNSKAPAEAASGFEIASTPAGKVASEIEILQSRSLVKRAVLASGFNVDLKLPGQTSLPYWRWRLSGRDPAALEPALDEVRAVDTSLPDDARSPRRFEVRMRDEATYEVWGPGHILGVGTVGERFDAGELVLTLMPGLRTKPRAGAKYELLVRPTNVATTDALSVLKVYAPKETANGDLVNVVTLEFKSASPRASVEFLQQLMMAYLAERQSWKTEDATAAESFVGEQMRSVHASIDEIQSKLADYRSHNKALVLDDAAKAMVEQIGKYEEQRAGARLEVASLASLRGALAQPNPPQGAFLMGQTNDLVFANMAQSLSEARDKLTSLTAQFNDAAPSVREQRALIDSQLEGIRNYVGSRLTRSQDNLRTLDGIIGQFDDKLKTVPAAELGLAQLARESEVYTKTYAFLLEQQQQAAITKVSRLSKNRILYAPELPLKEDSPSLVLRGGSFFLGLALGAALIVLQTIFSSTFVSRADVARTVDGLPVVGAIPRRPASKRGFEATTLLDIADADCDGNFAEAFRAARANLYAWSSAAPGGQVLLVTSPSRGDGKTTCAFALAAILAADGKRALVIDADLRAAVPVANAGGLNRILRGDCGWRDVAIVLARTGGGFQYIPSGGPGRPELLTAERMRDLCLELRTAFDFVLVDCPAFPEVSDAIPLSRLADRTLSVVRLGHTPRAAAEAHLSELADHVQNFGIVVNDVPGPSGRRSPRRSVRRQAPFVADAIRDHATSTRPASVSREITTREAATGTDGLRR